MVQLKGFCDTCKFSTPMGKLECRRNPPAVNPNFIALGAFPIVNSSLWCGEYKEKNEGK